MLRPITYGSSRVAGVTGVTEWRLCLLYSRIS
jgi:hypothetical protein